jgi:adenylate kinase
LRGSTIFITGAYGVGKSTLCLNISDKLQIPAFSAGDLISKLNGEQYGANKTVADKNENQLLLAKKVQELNQENERIILAGHFCIFDDNNDVELLPETVFTALNISRIVLLEADTSIIVGHLQNRDKKVYSIESITKLIEKEREQSFKISIRLGCPLIIYEMTFSNKDTENVVALLQGG